MLRTSIALAAKQFGPIAQALSILAFPHHLSVGKLRFPTPAPLTRQEGRTIGRMFVPNQNPRHRAVGLSGRR